MFRVNNIAYFLDFSDALCAHFADKYFVRRIQRASYGLYNAQGRGRLFIGPGVNVYEGMIVGENPKNEDIVCNVCKRKQATNMRAAGSDDALKLVPPSILSLEQCLEFIKNDELVEITPKSTRIRKRILNKEQRMKYEARNK